MKEITVTCQSCGRPLIKRLPNGVWHFMFGRQVSGDRPAVDLYVQGNMKIRCWRTDCGFFNTLNYFPKGEEL
jgi:hypothetical protein